jgi:hypothetical protein
MAKNIKDRSNRQNVSRLLTILNQKFTSTNMNTHYELGLFCYVGINEYGEEIIEFIEPEIKLDLFYYSCANKFEIDILKKYPTTNISGTLIFANGDDCLGYQFKSGQFVKIFGLNGNLVKRHNKGGYSANRFARIAEESRHLYVVRICDRIKDIVQSNSTNMNQNIWIFGSEEIVQMVIKQSDIKVSNGGFLNFNSNTISNSQYWIEFLTNSNKENYDKYYKEILEYLEINPDILDFDPTNKNSMKYFIHNEKKDSNKMDIIQNQIPLDKNSKYYSKLVIFEYIGVKYYNYQTE